MTASARGLAPAVLLPFVGPAALLLVRPQAPGFAILLGIALALRGRVEIATRFVVSLVPILLLAAGFLAPAAALDWFLRLTVLVGVALCLARGEPRRSSKLLAITFLLLLIAAAQTEEWVFAIPFAAFVMLLAPALRSIELEARGEGDRGREGATGLAIGAVGLVVFFLLPRSGHQLLGQGEGFQPVQAAMTERIDLDSITSVKQSSRIALRVKVSHPVPEDHKWRGVAFDTFDGHAWSIETRLAKPLSLGMSLSGEVRTVPQGVPVLHQEIWVEPGLSQCLFTSRAVVRIGSKVLFHPKLNRRGDDFLLLWVPRGAFPYFVDSIAPQGVHEVETDLGRYLALPPLPPRVSQLAQSIVAGRPTSRAKIEAIETFLRDDYVYALGVQHKGASPLDHFLFDDRRGHCELFATAAAILARTQGIPARVVDGFRRGEYSGISDSYVVRRSDAHAWVEAYVDGEGWIELDPTPSEPSPSGLAGRLRGFGAWAVAVWNGYVADFGVVEQRALLRRAAVWARHCPVSAPAAMSAGAGGIGIGILLRRFRRRSSRDPISQLTPFLGRAVSLLRKLGIETAPGDTCRELLARSRARARLPSFEALVALHENFTYGASCPMTPRDAARQSRRCVRRLRSEIQGALARM